MKHGHKIIVAIKKNIIHILWTIASFALMLHWGAMALIAMAITYPIIDQIEKI